MDHEIDLAFKICMFFLYIIQILANLAVLAAYFTDHHLLANENIILLVSLAFIDFLYALLSVPYLVVLLVGWVPNGEVYNCNAYVVLGLGCGPTALMKSGCTITTLIALDRVCALAFPIKYFTMNKRKKCILYCGFIFALLMAGVDLLLLFLLTDIHPVPGCSNVTCFISYEFYIYWAMSNMAVNLLSCLLTVIFAVLLEKRNKIQIGSDTGSVQMVDKHANRASFYILVVSAIFGVIPSGINGCARIFQLDIPSKMQFLASFCASVSGVSHAFIFGMAYHGIRNRICEMLKSSLCRCKILSCVTQKSTNQVVQFIRPINK